MSMIDVIHMTRMCPECSSQELAWSNDKWKCMYCGRIGNGVIEVESDYSGMPSTMTVTVQQDVKNRTCPSCGKVVDRGEKMCARCGICVGCEGADYDKRN